MVRQDHRQPPWHSLLHHANAALGVELRLPILNHLVSDVLATALDGLDREAVDHVEDVCRDPLGDL